MKNILIIKNKSIKTRGSWATSLTWENGYNQWTHTIIIMLIKRRKHPLFTLRKLNGSSFKQTWIPFTQGCFVPNLVEIGLVPLEKKIFLISSMYFRYFGIISPWKNAVPFIWINLNPHHPRMLCAKFGWNWPCGSGEEDENVKTTTTDKFWSEKLTWAFGSGEWKMDTIHFKMFHVIF